MERAENKPRRIEAPLKLNRPKHARTALSLACLPAALALAAAFLSPAQDALADQYCALVVEYKGASAIPVHIVAVDAADPANRKLADESPKLGDPPFVIGAPSGDGVISGLVRIVLDNGAAQTFRGPCDNRNAPTHIIGLRTSGKEGLIIDFPVPGYTVESTTESYTPTPLATQPTTPTPAITLTPSVTSTLSPEALAAFQTRVAFQTGRTTTATPGPSIPPSPASTSKAESLTATSTARATASSTITPQPSPPASLNVGLAATIEAMGRDSALREQAQERALIYLSTRVAELERRPMKISAEQYNNDANTSGSLRFLDNTGVVAVSTGAALVLVSGLAVGTLLSALYYNRRRRP